MTHLHGDDGNPTIPVDYRIYDTWYDDGKLFVQYDYGFGRATSLILEAGVPTKDNQVYTKEVVQRVAQDMRTAVENHVRSVKQLRNFVFDSVEAALDPETGPGSLGVEKPEALSEVTLRPVKENRAHRRRLKKEAAKQLRMPRKRG